MEIIPKPKKVLSLEIILLYFSISIFICLSALSLYFLNLENSRKKEIAKIEEKILSLKTPEFKKKEEELLKYQQKISDFSELLKYYLHCSKIFPILEQKTLKEIYFSKMDFDPQKSTILLYGHSPNFYILGQQLEILKEDPSFKVQLKEIHLGKEGKVDFQIEISFNKGAIK